MKRRIVLHPKNLFFEKTIQLEFTLRFIEFIESINILTSTRIIFIYFVPIFGLMRYFIPVLLNDLNVFSVSYFTNHIFDIILIFFPFIMYFMFTLVFRKTSSDENNGCVFSENTVIISTKTYKAKIKFKAINKVKITRKDKTEIRLCTINKVVITKKLILFRFEEYAVYAIPKRAFNSEEELNFFIKRLKYYSN